MTVWRVRAISVDWSSKEPNLLTAALNEGWEPFSVTQPHDWRSPEIVWLRKLVELDD